MNLTQDEDGKLFYVPNYCINDPFLEKQYKESKNNKEKKIIKVIVFLIQLILFDLYENKKINLDVSDNMTGGELKDKCCEHFIPQGGFRFFFGGAEIKNEHKLYQHNLKDDYIIQILKKPIDN
jgi:hypothetical protein